MTSFRVALLAVLGCLAASCAPSATPDGGRADGGSADGDGAGDAGDLGDGDDDGGHRDAGAAGRDAGADVGGADGGDDDDGDAGDDDGGGALADGGIAGDGGAAGLVDAGGADAGSAPLVDLATVQWIHGNADCATTTDPPIQVVRVDADTFVLRQSKCVHFEAPFLYLLIGAHTALLEDTGATQSASAFPIYETVRGLLDDVLQERGQASIDLVVVHSHGHGDHVAADAQFSGRPGVTVVPANVAALQDAFGIATWPTDTGAIDLGGRVVDVIPIPGHQGAHVALYDRRNAWLLTGDSLYPGRLYVGAWSTYVASIGRLVDFVADKPVAHVLGTHVEMSTTPGNDYPIGTTYQPDEHPLPLSKDHLLELHDALQSLGGPTYDVHDDFIVYPT